MKELIKELKKNNPRVDQNIYKALDNVNMNCIIGWTKNGDKHSFIDEYEKYQNSKRIDEKKFAIAAKNIKLTRTVRSL